MPQVRDEQCDRERIISLTAILRRGSKCTLIVIDTVNTNSYVSCRLALSRYVFGEVIAQSTFPIPDRLLETTADTSQHIEARGLTHTSCREIEIPYPERIQYPPTLTVE
jgi:hypothetical protein